MTETSFTMTIGADISEIQEVSTRLEGAMSGGGFGTDAILDTQLAVEEVITNVIIHGYKRAGGAITISCRISSDYAEIEVTDQAPPFNPLSMPEPDLEGNVDDRKIGGLGIYLLRQVMDEVTYRFGDGSNTLTMRKKRKE